MSRHKKMNKLSACLGMLFSLSLATSGALASVDSDLNNFYQGLGYQSNVTSPAAFQDQAAGYYSGGSLFLRNQVKNYQLISVELPSFSGGCSGIDTYLGSFSVISTEQLTQMMKNILSSGGAYAFDLALTTTVPQIKSVKDYIQKYVNEINNANINSCNTAEDLVGGIWPKTQSSQQQICRDVGSHNGVFTDWAAARQGCGTGGRFNEGISRASKRSNEVIVNKNLVWDALMKNGLTGNDRALSELLMNLSGTIIYRSQGDKTSMSVLVSRANSQELVKALLDGGKVNILACDETQKCLNPTNKVVSISQQNALRRQVTEMIQKLNLDVMNDSGILTEKTRGFLEMTPIPVLKYITNSLALGKAVNPNQFSDIISISLLSQYLSENIQIVSTALSREDTPLSGQMMKQINLAQQDIAEKMNESYRKLANINVLINQMRSDEQQLTSRLIDQASVGQETK